ncbi:aminotransferase class I/II-fold pyridoxal phosphate-dependent enzyme [Henriciella aquimarina]|uniref:aminotransferase class I/II-fold pyridoxal phosphate-dependent enzyme n=1 Tax=Henriciella aquimarina TaxID=545261 RepID=UPI000A069682|nr:8-amino-7-oxononanoate synthase [Henriciella aquimarina]
MSSLERLTRHAEARLERLRAAGQHRSLKPTSRGPEARARRGGRGLVSFCDNDYLSLSCDPRLAAAAGDAANRYGVGAGASRLVTGDCPLNGALEKRLADMKGMEACLVFGSGYLANVGTIPALVGKADTILMDALSHSCMHAGARLSGAEIRVFRHNDVAHAGELMREAQGQVLVLTETVFSMDGDLAPLEELAALCEQHGAWLMTDDAHGLGVVAQTNPAPIQMGTLSKAAGAYGGYVCAPAPVIDMLTSRARSLVYTTGLPPPVLAAAITALDIMRDEPDRARRAMANAKLFCELMGLPAPESVIVPVIIGEESRAMAISDALEREGYLVTAIRPPTVPEGTSRLRVTFAAGHTEDDVRGLGEALGRAMAA